MPATINTVSKRGYLTLSFVFPVVILGTVFALNEMYPFGGYKLLIGDLREQYFPFLVGLWHKLREGTLSPWSWIAGAGHDYVALIAYYVASPLNLLVFFVPYTWLEGAIAVILLLKIGCAGLFTGIFLRQTYKQCGPALPVFSSLYALCAFTLGYFQHIIWLDSFALLPLVMTGFFALTRKGKYKLYVITLALSVLGNYYMGFYICVFVIVTFIGECIIQKPKTRIFFKKLALIAACSVLAVGISAVLLFPSFFALRSASVWTNKLPSKFEIDPGFLSVLGNFIAFTPPTYVTGLPNLYCGLISVLLVGVFMQSPKVSRREKIVQAVIIIFLVLCCSINVLHYIINGFHFPNECPFRFSFLVSFMLVVTAYRAFLLAEDINKHNLFVMGLSAALILLSAAFGPQEKRYIVASAGICALYVAAFFFMGKRNPNVLKFLKPVFFLLVLAELSATSFIAIKIFRLPTKYYDRNNEIQQLLSMRRSSPNDFYRTETNFFITDNDPYFYNYNFFIDNNPYLYNYNGIRFFSSTVNANIYEFISNLVLNKYFSLNNINYIDPSPLTNSFLNTRYLISLGGYQAVNDIYLRLVGKVGDVELLENTRYLPLGFMVNRDLVGYVYHDTQVQSQNDFFRRATGLAGDLFTETGLTPNENYTVWYYEMPSDGMLYVFYRNISKPDTMTIFVNGRSSSQKYIRDTSDIYVSLVGSFSKGELISFTKGSDTEAVALCFDTALFDQGYDLLSGQTLNLTKFTNTAVCGSVTALRDGLLYTSIPGDKNWSVFVDGVKSNIVLIDGAMASVELNKGYHEIEFRYFNKSFLAGIIVSLVSLAIFVLLAALENKRSILFVFIDKYIMRVFHVIHDKEKS
jgi:uncharacterized membrane protein YfhO